MKELIENPNPPYGQKSGFRKLTVSLPEELYDRLIRESARRKINREPNQLLSAMLREALMDYLQKIDTDWAHSEQTIQRS